MFNSRMSDSTTSEICAQNLKTRKNQLDLVQYPFPCVQKCKKYQLLERRRRMNCVIWPVPTSCTVSVGNVQRWRASCVVSGNEKRLYFLVYILVVSLLERTETSAHTAGRKKEPIHKYPFAVVVRIVGEQPMPFVLLLTVAFAVAFLGLNSPAKFRRDTNYTQLNFQQFDFEYAL